MHGKEGRKELDTPTFSWPSMLRLELIHDRAVATWSVDVSVDADPKRHIVHRSIRMK